MGSYIFDGVDDKLSVNTAVVTAVPFTIGVWFEVNNLSAYHGLVCLADTASTNNFFQVYADHLSDSVTVHTRSAAANVAFVATTDYTADSWRSATGVWSSATDRRVFMDGGGKATSSTSVTPSSIDRLSIGCQGRSADDLFLAGHIAYVFIWNIALSDAEVSTWHGGTIPQEEDLVAAYDLTFDHAGSIADEISTNNLTVSGSTYDGATSPPVTYDFGGAVVAGLFAQRRLGTSWR